MKKILLASLLFVALNLNAQGRREGQSSIHAQYGYAIEKDSLAGTGTMFKAGYGRVFGNKGFLGKAEVFYQKYNVMYTDRQVLPYQKYGVNVNAGYSYEGLNPVFINVYLGGYGAYETVNDGNARDPRYNAIIPIKTKSFVYGISGSAEIEIALMRNLSIVLDYTQFYDLKSKFSKSNYGFFGGLKYNID